MDRPARRKIYVVPLARQEREMHKLVREGRYRNTTHFVRSAIDCYLDRLGRPTLPEQARQMAEDFHNDPNARDPGVEAAQNASRATDENW